MMAVLAPEAVHLLLFSRAPRAGETKTRLIPALGAEAACALHVACLRDLFAEADGWRRWEPGGGTAGAVRSAACSAVPAAARRVHLFITPPATEEVFAARGVPIPPWMQVHAQRGEDLGARMADAFTQVQAGAPGANVGLLCGVDLPLLHAACWEQAVSALEHADAVFGPTPDGGYYLVGLRVAPAGVFDLPTWGEGSVLRRSLHAAESLGLRTACIETLPDVDEVADIAQVLEHPRAGPLSGRLSLQYLRSLAKRGSWPPRQYGTPG